MGHTKIVATLGPASDSPEIIRQLLEAGVDVFRLNASHGSQEEHGRRIGWVRQAARDAGILLDLQGPKIRLGTFEGGRAVLETGAEFTITAEPVPGSNRRASTSYANLARDVKPGDPVLLADGAVTLKVIETDGVAARCEVVSGGVIGDRKGINLPGVRVSSPSLTEKDLADLRFGLEAGIDLVGLSFVRTPEDVRALRRIEPRLPIVAKIEKPEAWEHLDGILEEADGVMVARGDLGVEVALEKVPFIQKSVIERARMRGRFSITATQMLESMIEHPWPTRAEVSDIANAIYDGTDAVMLSAETSAGRYPVEAARMMSRIVDETETSLRRRGFPPLPHPADGGDPEIVADAATHAAESASVAAIAVFTTSGSSARLIARRRPLVPIYAFTSSEATARQLAVVFGVRAMLVPALGTTDEMLGCLEHALLDRGLLRPGDKVVFVSGQPIGRPGTTNLIKLHTLAGRQQPPAGPV